MIYIALRVSYCTHSVFSALALSYFRFYLLALAVLRPLPAPSEHLSNFCSKK